MQWCPYAALRGPVPRVLLITPPISGLWLVETRSRDPSARLPLVLVIAQPISWETAVSSVLMQQNSNIGRITIHLYTAATVKMFYTWKDVRGETSNSNLPHSPCWYQIQRWGGNCLATLVTSVERGEWCDVNKMMFKYFLLSCQAESWCPQRCQVFKLIWVVVGVYNSGWTLLQQLQQHTTADNSTPYQLIRHEDRGHPPLESSNYDIDIRCTI